MRSKHVEPAENSNQSTTAKQDYSKNKPYNNPVKANYRTSKRLRYYGEVGGN
jgi:hypothetical protein